MRRNGIFLGMGSNLGDREASLTTAIDRLESEYTIKVVRVSRFIETSPWGVIDQPMFINAVIEIETDLSPHDLLNVCKELEQKAGRIKTVKWGPRTLDIDILYYHQLTMNEPELVIPHPRIAERDFVLTPLQEIAPDFVGPDENG